MANRQPANRNFFQIDTRVLPVFVQGHIQHVGAKMLSDQKWLDEVYFPGNLQKLQDAFQSCHTFLAEFLVSSCGSF